MPVKAEDTAKSLEPVGVRHTPQHLIRAEVSDNSQRNFPGQLYHARKEPGRRFTVMEGEVSDAGPGGDSHSFYASWLVATGAAMGSAAAGTGTAGAGDRGDFSSLVSGERSAGGDYAVSGIMALRTGSLFAGLA